MQKEFDVADQHFEKQQNKNDRDSSTTVATEGEYPLENLQSLLPQLTRNYDERFQIFRTFRKDNQVSHKIIEKAISWISTIGYIKQLPFETILLSIALFYASLNFLSINKDSLESILCACLLLSCKMTSHKELGLEELLVLIDNRQTTKNVIEQQAKILSALDFNLHFDFPIMQLIEHPSLDFEQKEKLKFLSELMLLKQPTLFFQISEMENLFRLVVSPNSENSEDFGNQVKKMLKKKSSQLLLNKYNSKFDVGSFIIQIDHISSCL